MIRGISRTCFIVRHFTKRPVRLNVQPSFAFDARTVERWVSVRMDDYLIDQLSPRRDNKHSFD